MALQSAFFISCSLHTPLLTEHPLLGRTTAAGLAFISADYRLLPPSTGHDVLEDVVDLFTFLGRTPTLGSLHLDASRLAVAGSSAGGMCAFLAAIHAKPRPRAVLSLYGLGGEVFVGVLSTMRRLAWLTHTPATPYRRPRTSSFRRPNHFSWAMRC